MKLTIKLHFLFCTFFFGAFQLLAQLPCEDLPLPQEQVRLHLDRNLCLAGETIWFKAWCFLDGQLEAEMSKVLYLEIFDETQKVIVQEKYLLSNNKAVGSIRIPEDVPSKHYFLRAYTRYMRNFSSADFHYQKVTIVNPFIEGESIQAEDANSVESQKDIPTQAYVSNGSEKLLQIELKKEKYEAREQIDFTINSLEPITAELSTAVRLRGLGNQPLQNVVLQNQWLLPSCQEDPFCREAYSTKRELTNSTNGGEQKGALSLNVNQLQWLPETRGLTISGLVQNKKKEKISGALSMVSVLQKKPLLYTGTTDEDGAFTICLHDMQDQKNLFVGTPNGKNNILIRNDFDSNFPDITTIPLQFDSSLHHLLESLNLHQQLERIYPQNKTQAVFQVDPLNIASTNILAPDRRVELANFIKMTTMSEVFEEITPGVLLRKKDGKESLNVFNSKTQERFDSPLILLDNVPIFDIPELLKIDPSKIEAIDIYKSNYFLGDYTIGAIISIISKTDDFAAYKWGDQVAFTKFKTFSIAQPFEQVLHLEKSHYPDFRPVVYWQPSLQLNQEKSSETISIYAPDRPGLYEVLVQGFSDLGEPCFGYVSFEVVREK
ncbi:MAG: hypothetical protein ACI8YQ_002477 [Polaribacter sp.]|jgi:hypothetical protein